MVAWRPPTSLPSITPSLPLYAYAPSIRAYRSASLYAYACCHLSSRIPSLPFSFSSHAGVLFLVLGWCVAFLVIWLLQLVLGWVGSVCGALMDREP